MSCSEHSLQTSEGGHADCCFYGEQEKYSSGFCSSSIVLGMYRRLHSMAWFGDGSSYRTRMRTVANPTRLLLLSCLPERIHFLRSLTPCILRYSRKLTLCTAGVVQATLEATSYSTVPPNASLPAGSSAGEALTER